MSSQISNNNNYTTVPASPNPYVFRKLNNIDQAQILKKEKRRLDKGIPQNVEKE